MQAIACQRAVPITAYVHSEQRGSTQADFAAGKTLAEEPFEIKVYLQICRSVSGDVTLFPRRCHGKYLAMRRTLPEIARTSGPFSGTIIFEFGYPHTLKDTIFT